MSITSLFRRGRIKGGAAGNNPEATQPALLGSAVRFPYGAFRFKTQLVKGTPYEIQATTNFKQWVSILSDDSPGEIEFVDPNASKFSSRFYRLNVNETYSANIIGYITVNLPPGFSMIANPLLSEDSSVAGLFKGMPSGAEVSRFDSRGYHLTTNICSRGKWTNPGERLLPGEGALVYNPTTDYIALSFAGEVRQGRLSVPVVAGFSIRSCPIPQPGRLDTELDFPIDEGDVIHLFDRDRQKYVLYPYRDSGWSGDAPLVGVGESFWVAKGSPRNWSCSLTFM